MAGRGCLLPDGPLATQTECRQRDGRGKSFAVAAFRRAGLDNGDRSALPTFIELLLVSTPFGGITNGDVLSISMGSSSFQAGMSACECGLGSCTSRGIGRGGITSSIRWVLLTVRIGLPPCVCSASISWPSRAPSRHHCPVPSSCETRLERKSWDTDATRSRTAA